MPPRLASLANADCGIARKYTTVVPQAHCLPALRAFADSHAQRNFLHGARCIMMGCNLTISGASGWLRAGPSHGTQGIIQRRCGGSNGTARL